MIGALKRVVAVWGVPVGMTGVYMWLMYTAETDTTGKAWMAIGLGFVWVIWFVFRMLTTSAALSRAIDVGDAAKIHEVADRYLRSHGSPGARAPYLVAKAYGYELANDWSKALSMLDGATLDAIPASKRPVWQRRAAATRIAALIGQGDVAGARAVLDAELPPDAPHPIHSDPYLLTHLAAGRVLAAEGKRAEASARFKRVTDDIRASAAMRAAVKTVEATR